MFTLLPFVSWKKQNPYWHSINGHWSPRIYCTYVFSFSHSSSNFMLHDQLVQVSCAFLWASSTFHFHTAPIATACQVHTNGHCCLRIYHILALNSRHSKVYHMIKTFLAHSIYKLMVFKIWCINLIMHHTMRHLSLMFGWPHFITTGFVKVWHRNFLWRMPNYVGGFNCNRASLWLLFHWLICSWLFMIIYRIKKEGCIALNCCLNSQKLTWW